MVVWHCRERWEMVHGDAWEKSHRFEAAFPILCMKRGGEGGGGGDGCDRTSISMGGPNKITQFDLGGGSDW